MAAETRPPPQRQLEGSFYAGVLNDADRDDFLAALEVTGLDQEIALLRTRLKGAAGAGENGNALLFRGLELLVKALRVRYRLGDHDSAELLASLQRMVTKSDETSGRSQT